MILPSRLIASSHVAVPLRDVAFGAGSSLVVCALLLPLRDSLTLANVAFCLLLVIIVVAMRSTRRAAFAAAIAATLGFAYVFVPPKLSLLITEVQYVLTALFMLAVALVIGELTTDLRRRAEDAQRREAHARLLYETAGKLTGAMSLEQAIAIARAMLRETLALDLELLDEREAQTRYPSCPSSDECLPASVGYDSQAAGNRLLRRLKVPAGVPCVAVIGPLDAASLADAELRQLLDTLVALLGIAIERIHYGDVAREALMHAESERLRNSLLTALSHDVRTPLAALVTTADALSLSSPTLTGIQRELTSSIRDQGMRLSGIVGKLLDMARLQSGAIRLQRRRQALEPVIRSAIATLGRALDRVTIELALADPLPEFPFDAVLLERVLQNLLENSAKHSSAGEKIVVSACLADAALVISVTDRGPGVAADMRERLFEKFAHGSRHAGVGLGLAISRTIVEFHGGSIGYETPPEGGARFTIRLPDDAGASQ